MVQADSNIVITPEAGAEHKGLRLDKFLAQVLPDVSRSTGAAPDRTGNGQL